VKFKEVDAFRAVMRSGSMTAAAADLHTSQPNISRLISQLEASTKLRLFHRAAGRLTPTEEAISLFQEVERAFVGMKSLQDSVDKIRQFGNGRLRIASVPSLAMSVLPKVLQRFNADHPKVTVSIHTSDTHTVSQWAGSQSCDLALVSYLPDLSAVDAEVVCDVAGTCILPPTHRLAARPHVVAEDLAGEAFISLGAGDGLRSTIDKAFVPDDRRLLLFETPYGATICQMVGLGLGLSIVNPIVARDYLHTGIHMRPFRPAIRCQSFLLMPKHRPRNALADRFTELLRLMLRKEEAASAAG
jgi:DNA-binding transcriptional LysR family regulator